MAAYSLGTYLLFAYFNPHVPFRYLMQIISPAAAALIVYVGEIGEAGNTCPRGVSSGVDSEPARHQLDPGSPSRSWYRRRSWWSARSHASVLVKP